MTKQHGTFTQTRMQREERTTGNAEKTDRCREMSGNAEGNPPDVEPNGTHKNTHTHTDTHRESRPDLF